jgi:hypothetical protein
MTELLLSLTAAGLWGLVFALFVLRTGRSLNLRREQAILAGWAAFFAFQVLLARLLDALGILTPAAARIAWVAAALIGVILHLRRGADPDPVERAGESGAEVDDDIRLGRRIALGCAALVLLGVCAFTLVSPVHIWDVLAYHMPMVASWVQNASLDAWPPS